MKAPCRTTLRRASVSDGNRDFEKTLLKPRRDGFRLIDLQRHDSAFSNLWYRKNGSLLGFTAEDVAMLLWELEEEESKTSTTVMTWRV